MNSTINRISPVIVRLSIALLLGVTWIIPAYNKLSAGGVPPFFVERFQNTFLASFPGIPASFYSIAILEAVAGVLVVLSLVTGEFLGRKGTPWLKAAILLSILLFVQLGFGLRLAGDNDGAASLFQYTVGAFVLFGVASWLESRDQEQSGAPNGA